MLPHAVDPTPPITTPSHYPHPRRSPSKPALVLTCKRHPTCHTLFTTASLHGSKDALAILNNLCTPASLLFDPKYTLRQRPSPRIPFRTFPPSPTAQRLPYSLPSTISVQNLDTEESAAKMDKRHPSSFQQLEKLGEGTYATVRYGYGSDIIAGRFCPLDCLSNPILWTERHFPAPPCLAIPFSTQELF
jgi:hypothetical protein